MNRHAPRRAPGPLRAALLAAVALAAPAFASDHADPMSINVFKVQESPAANITDLHAFVADPSGRAIGDARKPAASDFLIVSLCMRRALTPADEQGLDLDGFEFRLHLDLDPGLRFFDPAKTRDGRGYEAALASAAPDERDRLVAAHDADASQQALYGGLCTDPRNISAEATLTYRLALKKNDEGTFQAVLAGSRIDGIAAPVHTVVDRPGRPAALMSGSLNVSAGIYDDPFIFPRFFRRNVVAVVTAIPLASLRSPASGAPLLDAPILLWATTHKGGRQIDHVGRSLRTQLPRFGYLNTVPPRLHLEEIMRVHDRPDLMENVLATVISPLIAHRHYDMAPDVMVYHLGREARFPNGRRYEDDVAKLLADAGETLLFELSYAESKQFPRATVNDKPFRPDFPYLASRWTPDEIKRFAGAAAPRPSDPAIAPVPRAPDGSAIRRPNLTDGVWASLWLGESIGLVALAALLILALRSGVARVVVAVVAVAGLVYICPLRMPDDGSPGLPAANLVRAVVGVALIAALFLAWVFTLGRRSVRPPRPFGAGVGQGLAADDRQPPKISFQRLKDAAFSDPYSTRPWGAADAPAFPVREVTFRRLAAGWWSRAGFPFLAASRRTIISRADLRRGPEGKGVERLLHPNGVVLSGEWRIDPATPGCDYTGLFAAGAGGRVIARYSTCCTETRSGHPRSLALVAKIFSDATTPARPASLVTQEDLGGTVTASFRDAILTNSPPVTPSMRGASGILAFLVTALTLRRADLNITERQLYELAELGKPSGRRTACPRFLRLIATSDKSVAAGANVDFRDEVLGCIYDRGDPRPRRVLEFAIEVSDAGEHRGALRKRLLGQRWTRIGRLSFDEGAVTRTGDFVLHFHHPAWRKDRNDPASLAKPELSPT